MLYPAPLSFLRGPLAAGRWLPRAHASLFSRVQALLRNVGGATFPTSPTASGCLILEHRSSCLNAEVPWTPEASGRQAEERLLLKPHLCLASPPAVWPPLASKWVSPRSLHLFPRPINHPHKKPGFPSASREPPRRQTGFIKHKEQSLKLQSK